MCEVSAHLKCFARLLYTFQDQKRNTYKLWKATTKLKWERIHHFKGNTLKCKWNVKGTRDKHYYTTVRWKGQHGGFQCPFGIIRQAGHPSVCPHIRCTLSVNFEKIFQKCDILWFVLQLAICWESHVIHHLYTRPPQTQIGAPSTPWSLKKLEHFI